MLDATRVPVCLMLDMLEPRGAGTSVSLTRMVCGPSAKYILVAFILRKRMSISLVLFIFVTINKSFDVVSCIWRISINMIVQSDYTNPVGLLLQICCNHPTDRCEP